MRRGWRGWIIFTNAHYRRRISPPERVRICSGGTHRCCSERFLPEKPGEVHFQTHTHTYTRVYNLQYTYYVYYARTPTHIQSSVKSWSHAIHSRDNPVVLHPAAPHSPPCTAYTLLPTPIHTHNNNNNNIRSLPVLSHYPLPIQHRRRLSPSSNTHTHTHTHVSRIHV